jgi:hypothetical protein
MRLAAGERKRAERHDEENALYPEGDSVEDTAGQEIQ